jgi:putative ABC transport system ATP-binding protein
MGCVAERQLMRCIQTNNISKSYGRGRAKREILSRISLSIETGEFVSITGPSGCGKSTLLSILGLLQTPSDGELIINGTPCTALSGSARAKIRRNSLGFVFQDFALLSNFTVEQNILLPLVYDGIRKKEAQNRVREVAGRLGITPLLQQHPTEISGGEKQRVALARTLIRAPRIILADEPTGNLDSANAEYVFACFREITGMAGATVVVVTHDTRFAARTDRVIKLVGLKA